MKKSTVKEYYQRLYDNVPNMEKVIENYLSQMINSYKNRIQTYYVSDFNNNPNKYILSKNIDFLILYLNSKIRILGFEGTQNTYKHVNCIIVDGEKYDEIYYAPPHIKKDYYRTLIPTFYQNNVVIYDDIIYYPMDDYDVIPNCQQSSAEYKGNNLADEHFQNNNSFLQSEIKIVNNPEFEYQINEASKCYNNSLFFACNLCLEVATETMLLELIKRKLPKQQIKDTYILSLANILKINNIIDQKMFTRISSINYMRRATAHTTTGKTLKTDCDSILALLKQLALIF